MLLRGEGIFNGGVAEVEFFGRPGMVVFFELVEVALTYDSLKVSIEHVFRDLARCFEAFIQHMGRDFLGDQVGTQKHNVKTDLGQGVLKAALDMTGTFFRGDSVHGRETTELEKMVQRALVITGFKSEKTFEVQRVEPDGLELAVIIVVHTGNDKLVDFGEGYRFSIVVQCDYRYVVLITEPGQGLVK